MKQGNHPRHPLRYTRLGWLAALLGAVLLLAGTSKEGIAHPHVWVTMETEILFTQGHRIIGFRHKWLFDKMYAAFAVQGLDKDGDGNYSRDELQELAQVNINDLKPFNYFTFPRAQDVIVEQNKPENYYFEYKDGFLVLYLTIPLTTPVEMTRLKDFSLTISDPTFLIDFAFAKNDPVRLVSGPPSCRPVIKSPEFSIAKGQSLGETFFEDANATAKLAAEYAKSITITCNSQ